MGFRIGDLMSATTPLDTGVLFEVEQGGASRKVTLGDMLPGIDNTLKEDLADAATATKGAALIGYKNSTVRARLLALEAAGVAGPCPTLAETSMNNPELPNGDYNVIVESLGFAPVNVNGYLNVKDNLSTGWACRTYTVVTTGRQYRQIVQAGTFGAWVEVQAPRVDTIAALRAVPKGTRDAATVLGYYAVGDAAGVRTYYYDAADTTSVDNGGTIIVATDGGRYKLVDTDSITVATFGAKNDGTTNNTPFVQAMINAGVKRIVYGPGTWHHTSSIVIPQAAQLDISGRGFRLTTLTASAATGFALFTYARTSGQAGAVVTFKDMTFSWTGTSKLAGSVAIRFYGFSDAASDNWFRTESCAFYNFEVARRGKWAGQVYSVGDFFIGNRYSNLMERGASFWYMTDCMSFDGTFVQASDPTGDAFSNGLFISGCHNVTASNECIFVEGWQAVFIDSCGFDLGSGGDSACWFKSCQDVYVSKCFISSNTSTTRKAVRFDATHTGAVTNCTVVNSAIGIQVSEPPLSMSAKIVIDGNKFEGNATNDVLLLSNVEGCKIINNHFQKQMARTGTAFEVYGNNTGVNNNIVAFNTFKGATYTISMGAGSVVANNIFGVKA